MNGERLRRENRRRDAREHLRTAYEMLRRRLRRARPPGTAGHRRVGTPTHRRGMADTHGAESQIARRAAEGSTNAKLDVNSRNKLRKALPAP